LGDWIPLVVELVKYPGSKSLFYLRFPDWNPDACGCSIKFWFGERRGVVVVVTGELFDDLFDLLTSTGF